MYRILILGAALASLVGSSPAQDKEAAEKKERDALRGAWDLTAYVVAGTKSDRIKGASVVIDSPSVVLPFRT